MTASSIESGYTHGFVFLLIASILLTAAAVAVRTARRQDTAAAVKTVAGKGLRVEPGRRNNGPTRPWKGA